MTKATSPTKPSSPSKRSSPTKAVAPDVQTKHHASDLATKVEKAVTAFNLWCQQCYKGDEAAHGKVSHTMKMFSPEWKCTFASGDKADYSGFMDWFNYDLKVANDATAVCSSANFETIWETETAILMRYEESWTRKGVPTLRYLSALWLKVADAPDGVQCYYWSESNGKLPGAEGHGNHEACTNKRPAEEPSTMPKSPKKTK
ncbi:hypothetical protein BASA83_001683 [Batrachochytrium salamandrivorans]|nr:hypothetical protein BASA62_001265 [Batrachochytrium salamandrivorans]KAH9254925.1 hypothetical protein BASA81_006992 [Batrachochytrium salamandrivorans]KAH9275877.1 hypothetical protein BASA83_001683 [Batrachochytrium salamandrivorans]